MNWEFVIFSKEDGIGTITLNRPDSMNALGGGMRQEILAALEVGGRGQRGQGHRDSPGRAKLSAQGEM